MTIGPGLFAGVGRRGWIAAGAAVAAVAILAFAYLFAASTPVPQGPTVAEKLSELVAARATLQAQADAETRIDLVGVFRVASLLTDALSIRHVRDRGRPFAALPPSQQRLFAQVDDVDTALRESITFPGEGSRRAARAAAQLAQGALDSLAGDGQPLVLQFSPRFVPPRRGGGELRLVPPSRRPPVVRSDGAPALLLGPGTKLAAGTTDPLVPIYMPAFAATATDDPPVEIEIAAVGLDDDAVPPMLTIGDWRGAARVSPLRLHFSVPRSAFANDAVRTRFVTGRLSFRHAAHTETVDLLFVVLPDQPGAFALDQKIRTMVPEANTLVSPEILARGDVGETKTVRHCFDPPPGTHFDKSQRRVVEVQRLGWLEDVSDPTLNDGKVEFAANEGPNQICIVVTAKPVNKDARAATIGRFEATLVRERAEDTAVKSGVRALDWHEAVRVPLDSSAIEWRLYLRLLGEINREFDQPLTGAAALPDGIPFLRVSRDRDGKSLILRADPSAEP
ncbi:hypothetical protein SAMN02745126_00024 [Enhydrobacter aerosaccus]|uniref:Uncharacterized protein n=1 Tax=Enhydrobacter aerosaccus TaxID=225324 RepID=A0A1T4JJY0_9HYPH|nr:hypothetical protein [Enhydrobacter aerosaccus]SJZ30482.1 hypothetical protein SAMN02745126_00024 [Enhydrobacter aerosaccus]